MHSPFRYLKHANANLQIKQHSGTTQILGVSPNTAAVDSNGKAVSKSTGKPFALPKGASLMVDARNLTDYLVDIELNWVGGIKAQDAGSALLEGKSAGKSGNSKGTSRRTLASMVWNTAVCPRRFFRVWLGSSNGNEGGTTQRFASASEGGQILWRAVTANNLARQRGGQ